ncbi:MAG: polymer-forming cytoskeletal protein [Firmicutes bacterium]|nr:polymer-forming cytoskeletal protein [Bacillota bacterium]
MFGRKEAEGASQERVETILGRGTEFRGALISSGVVRIDGKLEGEINHSGELVIGEHAVVVANVKSKQITVAGQIKGNVDCEGRLEIVPSGRLYGDIKVGHLVIAEGAVFQGVSVMRSSAPSPQDTAAKPNAKPA